VLLVVNAVSIILAFAFGRALPRSDEIAFEFGQGNKRSLYLLNVDRNLVFQLARGSNPFSSISWSPDGKHLAYVAPVNDRADIFCLDVE